MRSVMLCDTRSTRSPSVSTDFPAALRPPESLSRSRNSISTGFGILFTFLFQSRLNEAAKVSLLASPKGKYDYSDVMKIHCKMTFLLPDDPEASPYGFDFAPDEEETPVG
ncbi:hypothetical protein IMSAGC022_00512 [Alistipes sp.]|nr:hypothetical protein IMSAGC022_00512 [Alistipes sp.]